MYDLKGSKKLQSSTEDSQFLKTWRVRGQGQGPDPRDQCQGLDPRDQCQRLDLRDQRQGLEKLSSRPPPLLASSYATGS